MTTEQPYGFSIPIPFVESLGIRCTRMDQGHSELTLPIEHRHHNGWDMAHGGVLMTLLDVAMAVACRSMPPGLSPGHGDSAAGVDDYGVVTIEMKTSFMAPGRGTLRARGQLVHRTGSMAFAEAEVIDAESRTVARSSGTFKYVRREARNAGQPGAAGNGDG